MKVAVYYKKREKSQVFLKLNTEIQRHGEYY